MNTANVFMCNHKFLRFLIGQFKRKQEEFSGTKIPALQPFPSKLKNNWDMIE